MSSLRDYPYKFNDTEIIFPITWQETFNTVEEVNQSEAGTDVVAVTRLGKLSIAATYKVTNPWLKTFEAFANLDSFTLWRYDANIEGYNQHEVRMREFVSSRVQHSEDIEASIGLWEVSFTLEEF